MSNNEFLNEWKKQVDESGMGEESEAKDYENLSANIFAIAITVLVVAVAALIYAITLLAKVTQHI